MLYVGIKHCRTDALRWDQALTNRCFTLGSSIGEQMLYVGIKHWRTDALRWDQALPNRCFTLGSTLAKKVDLPTHGVPQKKLEFQR
jgi:DNA-directed RNA polymerase subunit N (RpoN/RPB10)